MKFALQLYSIRDCYHNGEELISALKKLKELGFDGVEFAGFCDLSAERVKEALDEIGLTPVSCHEGVDRLENDIDEILEFNSAIGNHNVACAYSPTANQADMDRLERVMKIAAEKAQKYGIRMLYHNHSHEFDPLPDGRRPIDLIKEFCDLEPDTYWVFNSRVDPYEFLKENAAHVGLVHLKDGDMEGHPCSIGEGSNHIQEILDASREIGAQWVILENDDPVPDGLTDVARSMKNLKEKYHL